MASCELQSPTGVPSLLNLDALEADQRAAAWHSGARTYFPGLSVRDMCVKPAVGALAGSRFGVGRLWTILSPPVQVSYDPAHLPADCSQLFSVMLQLRGSTLARQGARAALLGPGEMCFIDGIVPFDLSVEGSMSHIIVMQLPRRAVLSRYAYLETHTAETFDPDDSGTMLLRGLLLSVADRAATMEAEQRCAALNATVQLLGAPKLEARQRVDSPGWRVRAALAHIDSRLADPELTASCVAEAQGVSRRRLDDLMVTATGASVSSQIWSRRLEQAAADLVNDRFAAETITHIAFAAGFEDVAHFTRAFKRRYRVPPSEWRMQHRARRPKEPAVLIARRRN